jgi:hypothetical protein
MTSDAQETIDEQMNEVAQHIFLGQSSEVFPKILSEGLLWIDVVTLS